MDACRRTMLDGFAEVLDPAALESFDEAVPRRRWRAAIPESFWRRADVVAQMAEAPRRELHQSLVALVGPEAAGATMEYLPPVSWDVLEKHRVDHLLWHRASDYQ